MLSKKINHWWKYACNCVLYFCNALIFTSIFSNIIFNIFYFTIYYLSWCLIKMVIWCLFINYISRAHYPATISVCHFANNIFPIFNTGIFIVCYLLLCTWKFNSFRQYNCWFTGKMHRWTFCIKKIIIIIKKACIYISFFFINIIFPVIFKPKIKKCCCICIFIRLTKLRAACFHNNR